MLFQLLPTNIIPSVQASDVFSASESYQSTPTSHANSLSNYQTTSLNSANYTSVGTDDTDYLSTTATAGKTYVEDVFSTYLYTGNGTSQTINNGIDLQNNGGMVWIKDRGNTPNPGHIIIDSGKGWNSGGLTNILKTNETTQSTTISSTFSAYNN